MSRCTMTVRWQRRRHEPKLSSFKVSESRAGGNRTRFSRTKAMPFLTSNPESPTIARAPLELPLPPRRSRYTTDDAIQVIELFEC